MRLISFILISFLFFSCDKESFKNIDIIGHAGMGLSMQNSIYHDNSFEAVNLALLFQGSNGVEVDVQMDKKGCLWLFHNDNLEGETTENGCINDKQTDELEQVKYTSLHNEKLTKLQQILLLKDSTQKLFLDIRDMNAFSNSIIDINIFKSALATLEIDNIKNVFLIVSNQSWAINLAQTYSVFYCSDNFELSKMFLSQNTNISGLVIRNKYISKKQVAEITNLNKRIYLFDMRSPKGNRQALNKNPTGIISDDIRAALIERN